MSAAGSGDRQALGLGEDQVRSDRAEAASALVVPVGQRCSGRRLATGDAGRKSPLPCNATRPPAVERRDQDDLEAEKRQEGDVQGLSTLRHEPLG